MKICDEVGEYKHSGNMDFLNDVVEAMPAVANTLTSTTETSDELDTESEEIKSHMITSATKTRIAPAEAGKLVSLGNDSAWALHD